MKKLVVILVFLLIAGGCTGEKKEPAENALPAGGSVSDGTGTVNEVASGLRSPWSIDRHGDTFYVSERGGTIAEIGPDGAVRRLDAGLSAPLSGASEAGLMGFVLKPGFGESGEAYAYYTYQGDSGPVNRIVTLRRDDAGWQETEIHLDMVMSGPVHHGGRLALSPDGSLFATIGDRQDPGTAQDPASLNGKIIRMNEAGDPGNRTAGRHGASPCDFGRQRDLGAVRACLSQRSPLCGCAPG